MYELYDYLNYCLNKTFYKFPLKNVELIKLYIDSVIEQVIFDANNKFKGRKIINSTKELLDLIQAEPTMEAIMLYRIEHEIFLKNPENPFLQFLASLMYRQTDCEIYYSTEIGKGFNIMHGLGILIGPRYKIGDCFTIYQGATLGQRHKISPHETITIGNNVTVYAGAKIIGNINIGDNASISANAVLLCNVEVNATYAGIPAKRIN